MGVVKCEECDREFSENHAMEYPEKVHVHNGRIMCADCLADMGISLDETDPYITYLKTRIDLDTGV